VTSEPLLKRCLFIHNFKIQWSIHNWCYNLSETVRIFQARSGLVLLKTITLQSTYDNSSYIIMHTVGKVLTGIIRALKNPIALGGTGEGPVWGKPLLVELLPPLTPTTAFLSSEALVSVSKNNLVDSCEHCHKRTFPQNSKFDVHFSSKNYVNWTDLARCIYSFFIMGCV
jgi:hypothetical protein